MSMRDELKEKIALLREQIRDAKSRGNQELAEKLAIDLAVERDSLQLLNEEQADIDRDVPFHLSDPIQNYIHAKMRF